MVSGSREWTERLLEAAECAIEGLRDSGDLQLDALRKDLEDFRDRLRLQLSDPAPS